MAVFRMKSFDVDGKLDCSGKYSAGDALTTSLEQIRVGQALYLTGSLFNHSCMPNIHAYFISRTVYIRSTEIIVEGSPLELSYGPQVGQLDCKERRQFLEHQYSFKCQCTGCSELNLSDLVLNAYRCIKPDCLGVVLDKCMAEYQKNNVDKFESSGIDEVVSHVVNHGGWGSKTEPGYCLKCGSYRDLEVSHASINKAWSYIKRLEDAIVSGEISASRIFNYLRYLDLLRSILHAYNKKIAEVEDKFARGFCLVGELQPALDHCKASILILEKLYGSHHIAIGNELVKLVSIQLLLGDSAAIDSINQLAAIFWQYYGPQADIIFPHFQFLRREALSLV